MIGVFEDRDPRQSPPTQFEVYNPVLSWIAFILTMSCATQTQRVTTKEGAFMLNRISALVIPLFLLCLSSPSNATPTVEELLTAADNMARGDQRRARPPSN